jgi:hypothetical protein
VRASEVFEALIKYGYFKGCKDLTTLHLMPNDPKMTDAGLVAFRDCKKLARLVLHGKQVTDAWLVPFKDCKSLTTLYLNYTKVTDAGLAHLTGFTGLTFLDVRKTGVTAKGLAAFHAALPRCRIEYDGGVMEAKK